MSRPDPRQQAAAMPAAFAGAIDLSALKNRATRRRSGPGRGWRSVGGTPDAPPARPTSSTSTRRASAALLQASSRVLVVIDLWASWAEPGKPLSAILQRLAAASGGTWILGRVDVDANPRIAQAFGVQTLPMVVALAQGQPITDPLTAVVPEAAGPAMDLVAAGRAARASARDQGGRGARRGGAGRSARTGGDPRFVAAEEALAAGDYAAAELAYQQILAVEPANAEAKAALAQTGLLSRVEQHGPTSIARPTPRRTTSQAQRDAADLQLANGDIEGAFARLVETVRRTSGDDRVAVREHLVELFTLFPPDDQQVIKARRALAAALY